MQFSWVLGGSHWLEWGQRCVGLVLDIEQDSEMSLGIEYILQEEGGGVVYQSCWLLKA